MIVESAKETSDRLHEIRKQRAFRTLSAAFSTIAIWQLMFSAFAVGASRGPRPLSAIELIIGVGSALFLGMLFTSPAARRRVEADAECVLRLTEGHHRRRVVVFADHFTVDREVILASDVESMSFEDSHLVLKYTDPRVGGRVLRELSGKRPILLRLQRTLQKIG